MSSSFQISLELAGLNCDEYIPYLGLYRGRIRPGGRGRDRERARRPSDQPALDLTLTAPRSLRCRVVAVLAISNLEACLLRAPALREHSGSEWQASQLSPGLITN